ncbi:glutamine--fructose-6-phosphate transaminase [Hydrogenivirga caldilitoris]|uniref:Glutamine--fructose-6-phosphate aminotransferase [isomerizing] n=1 Tax=Hydrogenivirga caldilitoris TaxID=246264 RepID=A0A497XP00_9AQUI|nr:glutamine--fructose-6-phosphate transaminase (isomerizing) [Hydrogenivirga caldilitoris]RLJ70024.1 glutamine--fructose-6-phosphate transaminase [Hydrogenivirga caldilitoris]
MCGIIGYTGKEAALPLILGGLERLEYRGYDSAGIALIEDGKLIVEKRVGKIRELVKNLWGKPYRGKTGIGHTRWATHGEPSQENAHPHTDSKNEFAVVHNGIVENYLELKRELESEGVTFRSGTDTEVIAHLIARAYKGDLLEAVLDIVGRLKGAFAFAVITVHEPMRVVGVKQGSPLVVGIGEGENFLASDIPAILPYTRSIITLNDGEIADITPEGVNIYDFNGNPVTKEIVIVPWDIISAEKSGFKHFMLKEIYEQPKAVGDTIRGLMSSGEEPPFSLKSFRRILIIACGTSYHAGLVGKFWIEKLAGVPTEVVYASEFRYGDFPVGEEDLIIGVSQSGETIDTKFAVNFARERGARTLSIVNVVGSSIDRESDYTLHTHAGPEIGVAATKTFTAQLAALYFLASTEHPDRYKLLEELFKVPARIERTLEKSEAIEKLADRYMNRRDFLYLGRYLSYPIALEGALKLKEISYIHAEGYPAGEMKHGPIALIDEKMPVVVLAPQDRVYDKTLANIEEVKTRKGKVIGVGFEGDDKLEKLCNEFIGVPPIEEDFTPFLTVVPLQLLAYHIASKLGLDVDQPRNLAKTVTVE